MIGYELFGGEKLFMMSAGLALIVGVMAIIALVMSNTKNDAREGFVVLGLALALGLLGSLVLVPLIVCLVLGVVYALYRGGKLALSKG